MTVQGLIDKAFHLVELSAVGESLSTAVYADALAQLNQMLSSWSTEGASVYSQVHQSFSLTAGVSAYTLGTIGTLTTSAAPVHVYAAASVLSLSNLRKHVDIVSFEEFAKRAEDPLATRSVFASVVAVDNAYPVKNVRVFPMPDTSPANLVLDYWTAMAAFVNLADTVTLPPGYEMAIHQNLAVMLDPQHARAGGKREALYAAAANSKASIVALNSNIAKLGTAPSAQSAEGA